MAHKLVDPEVSPTPAEYPLLVGVIKKLKYFRACRDAPMLRGNNAEMAAIRKTLNVVVCELEELLAGVVPHAPQEKEKDDQSRVAPLTAGVDGQELPQRGNQ